SLEELHTAFGELQENLQKVTAKKYPEILVQKQLTAGEELLIGANRDGDSHVYEQNGRGFGHLLVFGKGGIYTEVYQDISTAIVPITREIAEQMISESKVGKIIAGSRGKSPLAKDKLIDTLLAVQRLVTSYPQIISLDLNPVILTEKECVVVDIKLLLAQ
ncbi:acetate--CoA ligase family protein, partial [Candidatus Dojkabacteria bacterium]|nr:acetate--CoA ligase family protein [Candidatus Dojkabacteria bacterium]